MTVFYFHFCSQVKDGVDPDSTERSHAMAISLHRLIQEDCP